MADVTGVESVSKNLANEGMVQIPYDVAKWTFERLDATYKLIKDNLTHEEKMDMMRAIVKIRVGMLPVERVWREQQTSN